MKQKDLVGSIVRVPIQKRIEQALVLNTFAYKPKSEFEIRTIESIETLPDDPHYMPLDVYKRQVVYNANSLRFFALRSSIIG